MRTILLSLLGLALAVAVGFGVHLVTRETISLPVVRLQPAPEQQLTPTAATTTARLTTTERTTTERTNTAAPPVATTEVEVEVETENENDSGQGRGRGRSGDDSGGNSGEGGADD